MVFKFFLALQDYLAQTNEEYSHQNPCCYARKYPKSLNKLLGAYFTKMFQGESFFKECLFEGAGLISSSQKS